MKNWFGAFITTFILLVIAYSFYKFFYIDDFIKYDFKNCDPEIENCFVSECTDEDPRCTENMTEEGLYNFKVIELKNNNEIEYQCSDDNIEKFSNLIFFDVECSN